MNVNEENNPLIDYLKSRKRQYSAAAINDPLHKSFNLGKAEMCQELLDKLMENSSFASSNSMTEVSDSSSSAQFI